MVVIEDEGNAEPLAKVLLDGRLSTIEDTFRTGLVKRVNTSIHRDEEHCWLSLWGLTNNDTLNGFLGTAIVLPSSSSVQFTEDSVQYLLIGQMKANEHFLYYAGAGWTRSGDFTTVNDWNTYLANFARKPQTPLVISMLAE